MRHAALLPVLIVCGMAFGCVRTMMPGRSFSGDLPALNEEEKVICENLRRHVAKLAGEIGERNVGRPEALEAAARYIEEEFKKVGDDVGRQTYLFEGKDIANVELTIRGGTNAEEIVLVGAHYDSFAGAPGANDNASGVAAILELARLLKGTKLPRTVRFVAFVNEEPPYLQTEAMGSLHYARRCKDRGEKIVAMLNVDTIGYYSDEKGSQHWPFPANLIYPGVGNFIFFIGDIRSADLVTQCVGSFRSHTNFPCEGGAAPETMGNLNQTDLWPFIRMDIPAVMVTDTAPNRYKAIHTPGDTVEKIDYDKTARVVAGLGRVVREVAGKGGK